MKFLALGLIRIYQKGIAPILPRACRFTPSCSEYMYQAIHKLGGWQGAYLGVKRILRCHPWNPGGIDPVP